MNDAHHTIPLATTKEAAPGEQLMLAFKAPAPCLVLDARADDGAEIVEIAAGSKKAKKTDAADGAAWSDLLGQGGPASVPADGYVMVVLKNATDAPRVLGVHLLVAAVAVAEVVPSSAAPFATAPAMGDRFARVPAPARGNANTPFVRNAQPFAAQGNKIQTRVIPGGKRARPAAGGAGPQPGQIQTRVIGGRVITPPNHASFGQAPSGPQAGFAAQAPFGAPQAFGQQSPFGAPPGFAVPRAVPQQHAQAGGAYMMQPVRSTKAVNVKRVVTARGAKVRAAVTNGSARQVGIGTFGHAPSVLVSPGPGERAVVFRPGHAQALHHTLTRGVALPRVFIPAILRALAIGAQDMSPKSTGGSDIAVVFKEHHLPAIATIVMHGGARLPEPACSEVGAAIEHAFAILESLAQRNIPTPGPIAVETIGESGVDGEEVVEAASLAVEEARASSTGE